MAKVEMKFSSFSSQHDAAPGDVKKVDENDVPGLIGAGVAAPVSRSEAKKAGVEADQAATAK